MTSLSPIQQSAEPDRVGRQGRKQFLANKQDLLAQYEIGKLYSASHIVQTYHGKVAEGSFRKWVSEFLPKRFGVSSGYLISQGQLDDVKLPHFDVIIYDQLESPILWIEAGPDTSELGKARAFPCEYVQGILEVKSSLEPQTASESISKLEEIRPLLERVDSPEERYKQFLPSEFRCGSVFFEARREHEHKPNCLDPLMPSKPLRGYFGATILKGEGRSTDDAGRFWYLPAGDQIIKNSVGKDSGLVSKDFSLANSVKYGDGSTYAGILAWSPDEFPKFAFDLLAMVNGTYVQGSTSSNHALSYLKPGQICK